MDETVKFDIRQFIHVKFQLSDILVSDAPTEIEESTPYSFIFSRFRIAGQTRLKRQTDVEICVDIRIENVFRLSVETVVLDP